MCNEPLNPNLPHWRRPKEPHEVTAKPLEGAALESARRAQDVADAAFQGKRGAASIAEEIEDWKVYDHYYWEVSEELLFNRHPNVVTAHDVSEEVRKRLAGI